MGTLCSQGVGFIQCGLLLNRCVKHAYIHACSAWVDAVYLQVFSERLSHLCLEIH